MAKRLTEQHPLTKKLRALEDYMSGNKLSVEWNGYSMIFMHTGYVLLKMQNLHNGIELRRPDERNVMFTFFSQMKEEK